MCDGMGLYRGKRIDNGKWVEGYFVKKFDPLLLTEMCFILTQEYDTSCIDGTPTVLKSEMTWYRVDPTTVGQYAGVTEYSAFSTIKNPKKLFEGDYIEMELDNHSIRGVLERNGANFGIYDKWRWWNIEFDCWLLVKGNIYDNPEWLGGADHA